MDYWVPDGKGVVVAVIDSGVVANSDLSTAAKYDFTVTPAKKASGGDLHSTTYGHGSHVASLIANVGASSDKVYRGVARGRVDSRRSKCWTTPAPAARATSSPRSISASRTNTTLEIDIINLSLGHPIYEPAADDPLVQAVERAVGAGIAVIVSAGNHGRNIVTGDIGFGGISSPAMRRPRSPSGRVDFQGTQGWQDDRLRPTAPAARPGTTASPSPTCVVAGHRLPGLTGKASRFPRAHVSSLTVMPGAGHNFLTLSGTSMAAAVATGVAAQVLKTMRLATGESSLLRWPAASVDGQRDGRCASSTASPTAAVTRWASRRRCSRRSCRYTAVPLAGCTRAGARGGRTQPHGRLRDRPADDGGRSRTSSTSERFLVRRAGGLRHRPDDADRRADIDLVAAGPLGRPGDLGRLARVLPGRLGYIRSCGAIRFSGATRSCGAINWSGVTTDTSVVWGSQLLWGDSLVWGDRVVVRGRHAPC